MIGTAFTSTIAAAGSSLVAVTTLELTIRMVVALIVIGAMLWLLTRTAQRWTRGRAGRVPIQVVHQQRLDKHASVTLLAAGDRHFLVGTSGQAMVLLGEGDDLAPEPEPSGERRRPSRGPGRRRVGASDRSGRDGRRDRTDQTDGVAGDVTVDVRSAGDDSGRDRGLGNGGRGKGGPIRALQDRTVRRR
jgi:flagellar biogenesis protein FliO